MPAKKYTFNDYERSKKLEYSKRLFICKVCGKMFQNSNKTLHGRTKYHNLMKNIKETLQKASY